ncbi:MAG: hypothetical protein E6916_06165 [Clostridium cochlearium]|uniref:hypothetical protein n=1 Tax=Clostridium cochlearium TaxID=1494 RepID=UPI00280BD38F|nr:hypothetical protein [Clostridium cochlearium]MDU1443083.1 hypothetical protein [Clostridium cochlearium]
MLKIKKLIGLALASTIMLTSFIGCGSGGNDQKGKDDGQKLTIYCGLMEDYMVAAVKEFEKETGIKVDAVRMSSGEIMGRIKAEKENPKASVWYGGPADGFIQAKKRWTS